MSNFRRLPDGLPWHVRVYEHVYIWAGGEHVRRLHFIQFQQLSHGLPVSGQLLQASCWKYREAFEDACIQHEKSQQRQLILPPRPTLLRG